MMRIASPFDFWKALIAGFGPMYVASIEFAEERSHRVAAGVEGLRLELRVAEVLLEEALLDADDRRRVREVREVPEPEGLASAGRAAALPSAVAQALAARHRQRRRPGSRPPPRSRFLDISALLS